MSIKTRLAKLENKPAVLPPMPFLSDTELEKIISGGDDSNQFGNLSEREVKAFIRGRSMAELNDDELSYIIFGKTSEVAL